jgi:predicted  nucleic acid-binding Zn-ribbon protein
MNKQFEHLQVLTREQRELIKKLLTENRRLNALTQSMRQRIQDLEKTKLVIDREVADIPIGFDLIPESDLERY